MMCYRDRMFCDERDCATDCYRRYYGTTHEANAKRLGLLASFSRVRNTEYCKGYTTKEED